MPISVLAQETNTNNSQDNNNTNTNVEKNSESEETSLISNAVSGLLMEESTGEIIFEKDKDKQVAVASMTKMVAQIIILENIESGNIKWSDVVTASKNAADMGGSQIYLAANEKMTVRDLFKGISMASANDAVVAMAEYIAGSEDKFVKKMNDKVKELGLKNTVFKNATGLDEDGHFSSAYDMAIIARTLLSHQEILEFSGVYEDYLRVNTPNKFWLVNTNKLVRTYNGADGLKTGHTDNAKYCLAVTAKRDGMRLIAIVLGEDNAKVRNSEAAQLLDYGFNNKQIQLIKKSTDEIKKIKLDKATEKSITIVPKYDVSILKDKGISNTKYKTSVKVGKIVLPLKKGDVVGKISVLDNNKVRAEQKQKQGIDDAVYFQVYSKCLKNMTQVLDDQKQTKLIIFYHPHLKILTDGSVVAQADERLLNIFKKACASNKVIFLDMTERFIKEYNEKHILPYGFLNTAVGAGHLNENGHRMIAEELGKIIFAGSEVKEK